MKKLFLFFLSQIVLALGFSAFCFSTSLEQDSRLQKIVDIYTYKAKRLDSFSAGFFGIEDELHNFGDFPSLAYQQRSKTLLAQTLKELGTINESLLTQSKAKLFRLIKKDLENLIANYQFPMIYLSQDPLSNRLRDYLDSSNPELTDFPFTSFKNYQAYLKRAEGFKIYVDNQISIFNEAIEKNITLSCQAADKFPLSYERALESDIEKNPFYRPVLNFPESLTAEQRTQLKFKFAKMIQDLIVPNYQRFDQYFKTHYKPHCRKNFGLYALPNSKKWYEHHILLSTDLALTADQVHKLGLKEVARIQKDLETLKKTMNYRGDLKDFIFAMVNDQNNYFNSSKDLVDSFLKVKSQVRDHVKDYFSVEPKADYKIVESSNPNDASGQYSQPNETTNYGRFIINATDLHALPIYEVTTLSLHETIPGHHFQIGLAVEMKEHLSEYQRLLFSSNAFVEGWALYAEFLGNEMGLFTEPLQRFGHLNDEMLRAVRLVVDTGIHAQGWSQEKALHYAQTYLAMDRASLEVEINRYSVWPGQALGYKIGQLKIIELRKKAEKELKANFDIKDFHRQVLSQGSVSLTELELQINEWIQNTKIRATQ